MKKKQIIELANDTAHKLIEEGWRLDIYATDGYSSCGYDSCALVLRRDGNSAVVFMVHVGGHRIEGEAGDWLRIRYGSTRVPSAYAVGVSYYDDEPTRDESDWMENSARMRRFYEVEDASASCRDGWYLEDMCEALECIEVHYGRVRNSGGSGKYVDLALTDRMLGFVRRIKGFKTIDSRYIKVRKKFDKSCGRRRVCYEVLNTDSGNRVRFNLPWV